MDAQQIDICNFGQSNVQRSILWWKQVTHTVRQMYLLEFFPLIILNLKTWVGRHKLRIYKAKTNCSNWLSGQGSVWVQSFLFNSWSRSFKGSLRARLTAPHRCCSSISKSISYSLLTLPNRPQQAKTEWKTTSFDQESDEPWISHHFSHFQGLN